VAIANGLPIAGACSRARQVDGAVAAIDLVIAVDRAPARASVSGDIVSGDIVSGDDP